MTCAEPAGRRRLVSTSAWTNGGGQAMICDRWISTGSRPFEARAARSIFRSWVGSGSITIPWLRLARLNARVRQQFAGNEIEAIIAEGAPVGMGKHHWDGSGTHRAVAAEMDAQFHLSDLQLIERWACPGFVER